jgi:plasmid stabilization system protein ParE
MDIGDMPLGFPIVARYERQGLRRRTFGNYSIFYRAEHGRILIIRILHSAQDIERVLTPDD